ncbi:uncharacterized protein [Euphorbia lathyris]|uniref:uncharacterized protein n=1 Tax=Euphorbia lathyris TaxID=212925 RepID=UPI003314353E
MIGLKIGSDFLLELYNRSFFSSQHRSIYHRRNMESDQKSELIDQVIRKLVVEKRNEDENDQLLLSKLLSEFELSKSEELVDQKEVNSSTIVEKGSKNETQINAEDIMKELKEVKKQNAVTHWLLSAMIVLTLAWQVSEVSLLLHLKNGISHPLRFFGRKLLRTLRVPGISDRDKEHVSSSDSHSVALQMPEFPHMDMGANDKKS